MKIIMYIMNGKVFFIFYFVLSFGVCSAKDIRLECDVKGRTSFLILDKWDSESISPTRIHVLIKEKVDGKLIRVDSPSIKYYFYTLGKDIKANLAVFNPKDDKVVNSEYSSLDGITQPNDSTLDVFNDQSDENNYEITKLTTVRYGDSRNTYSSHIRIDRVTGIISFDSDTRDSRRNYDGVCSVVTKKNKF